MTLQKWEVTKKGEEGKNRTAIIKKFKRAESTKRFRQEIRTWWAWGGAGMAVLLKAPPGILVHKAGALLFPRHEDQSQPFTATLRIF